MIRYGTKALLAAGLALLASTAAVARSRHHAAAALPKRQAVLLDFSHSAPPPPPERALGLPDADTDARTGSDVARQMENAFAGGGGEYPARSGTNYWSLIQSASSLPNPFLTRAIAIIPSMASPVLYAGGPCVLAEYRPDYSHGRVAEERRRLFFPLVHQAACEQGLPVGLFDALIMQESRYNHLAVSPKGALGLAQLMPGTARQLGTNPYAVIDNLRGGARYLRQQIDRFGRYDLALAAYNSGPERVARLGRVPAIAETTNYVHQISSNWFGKRTAAASASPAPFRRAAMVFAPYAPGQ